MNRLFDVIKNFTSVNNFNLTKKYVKFEDLGTTDLRVDTMYLNKGSKTIKDEPISNILNCANRGGLRYKGSIKNSLEEVDYIVLYSNLTETHAPDYFITSASIFMYYGDNKEGRELLDTPKKANLILKKCFDALHEGRRGDIPPIFVFIRGERGKGVIFKGMAVPGASGLNVHNDLIKVEMTYDKKTFLTYKATFTILDIKDLSRSWIEDIMNGNALSENTPSIYRIWKERGIYTPLKENS